MRVYLLKMILFVYIVQGTLTPTLHALEWAYNLKLCIHVYNISYAFVPSFHVSCANGSIMLTEHLFFLVSPSGLRCGG